MIHLKWPSIEQYRNTVKNVTNKVRFKGFDENDKPIYDPFEKLPTLNFEGTVKLHGCFHGNSLVTLSNGSQERIKDIEIGTSILSYNENTNQIEHDIIVDTFKNDHEKEWLILEFDNGTSITCTEDHLFLTTDGWIEAKNLTEKSQFIQEDMCF